MWTIQEYAATPAGNGANDGNGRGARGVRLRRNRLKPADVGIAMTAFARSRAAGSNVTYTMTVTNSGPNAATEVAGHRRAPSGASFCLGHAEPRHAAARAPSSATWATITNSITATVTLVVTAIPAGR